jgi:site-specific DNA-methyltransferase (adenine-specific)
MTASSSWKNQLYFSDNLDILIKLYADHPQGYIDLIYVDPPFNSKRNYNILFEDIELTDTKAQKEAFADTWTNVSYMDALNHLSDLDINLYNFIKNLDNTNIAKSSISYITTIAVRLWYMHRLLKSSGSFYLHCDPTMSHYLKIVCDLVFGERNFKNEILWKRTNAHNIKSNYFGRVHDVILFYTKSDKYYWNEQYTDYSPEQLSRFKADESGKLYKAENLTFSSPNPNRQFEWRGVKPPANRSWGASLEQLEKWWEEGRILKRVDGAPRMDGLKIYLEGLKGKAMTDWWDDLGRVGNTSKESLGYPTQKPEALLERIMKASTKEDDVVADFFCGCGTTVAVAQKLKRRWLGVDISHLSVRLIAKRLLDSYGTDIVKTFEVHGFPKDIAAARELANNVKGGRLEFEDWIIEVLLHGVMNERRNEMGFDGYRTFAINSKKYVVMIEVKSGSASPSQVNHFIMTIKDKKGSMGVFICFEDQITKNMRIIAKKEGQFTDEFGNIHCDKIQLISVEDLLSGKRPVIPYSRTETFKQAEKKSSEADTQIKMELP